MSSNIASTAPGVDLKLTYETTQRRFSCSSKRPSWQSLAAQVKRKFNLPEDFNLGLSFVDAQGESALLSTDSQLERIWPAISEAGDLYLDSLAPLEFTILRLPPSQRKPAANSRSTASSTTILDESDIESDDNGIVAIGSDDDEHGIQVEADAHANDEEGGDKKKKKKRTTLQEDIRSFVHIVQDAIQDNDSIKKAFDKLLSHVHNKPEHDGHKDSDAEDANANLAEHIREETGNMDAMTAGIVSALLAPALMGPPPPPPGPPHHFPPHFGGPPHYPHHHHRGHGGPHGGRHYFGPPHHHGPPPPPPHGAPPPPPPHCGPPPPPPHCGPGGKGRHQMPPFFKGPHHHFDNTDHPSDEEFEDFHSHHGGPHRHGYGEGRQPLFPGSFRHGKNRGCPYDMPPPPPFPHHPFHGMMPGFGPFGGGRHVPSFGPRGPPPFPHMPEISPGLFGKYGPGLGPHRHGHHGRDAHFFRGDGGNGLDGLSGGFEAMRMNNNSPPAFGEEDDSTVSSDESEIEIVEEKRFAEFDGPLGRLGHRSHRHGHLDGPHPPPLLLHHKHNHVRHEDGSRRGPAERGGPHHKREQPGQRGPRPHRGDYDDLGPTQPRDSGERRSRNKGDTHHRHGHHHGRWA